MKQVETLKGVAVGDKFLIRGDWGWSRGAYWKTVECKSITPKRCIIGSAEYRLDNARPYGGHHGTLYEYSEVLAAEGRKFLRRKRVEEFNYTKLSDDAVEAVYKIISTGAKPCT